MIEIPPSSSSVLVLSVPRDPTVQRPRAVLPLPPSAQPHPRVPKREQRLGIGHIRHMHMRHHRGDMRGDPSGGPGLHSAHPLSQHIQEPHAVPLGQPMHHVGNHTVRNLVRLALMEAMPCPIVDFQGLVDRGSLLVEEFADSWVRNFVVGSVDDEQREGDLMHLSLDGVCCPQELCSRLESGVHIVPEDVFGCSLSFLLVSVCLGGKLWCGHNGQVRQVVGKRVQGVLHGCVGLHFLHDLAHGCHEHHAVNLQLWVIQVKSQRDCTSHRLAVYERRNRLPFPSAQVEEVRNVLHHQTKIFDQTETTLAQAVTLVVDPDNRVSFFAELCCQFGQKEIAVVAISVTDEHQGLGLSDAMGDR
mmetsp:Transcript_17750/g.36058  ORF Transcript_17750/g.36058 Transcript_17750/m.36058 type:complete len:359 (+) Transcript_17750:389-1465(+)